MSETQDDYDSPWKEALKRYFPDFMALFFHQAHVDIDWARGHEFLDKELQQVTPEAAAAPRLEPARILVAATQASAGASQAAPACC